MKLRYDRNSFGSYCAPRAEGNHVTAYWGRICIFNTDDTGATNMPFYNSFTTGSGDYCTNSANGYNTDGCGQAGYRFTIWTSSTSTKFVFEHRISEL